MELKVGQLLSEGKTKRVYTFEENEKKSDFVYITNKDDISAGDRSRNHRIMEGKGRITVETSSPIFEFLNAVGFETAFISRVKDSDNSFVARSCQMIPIEIVIRRIAFGTYLKLNPNVEKGFKFIEPVIEIHIKDDANHDPLWSLERLLSEQFIINGLLIDEKYMKQVFKISKLVFEVLERVWHSIDYQLVDLKVEFGVTIDENQNHSLILADIIDNETWRLWPYGDPSLMVDKQIYREYKEGEVDHKVIDFVRNEFQRVSDLTQKLFSVKTPELKFLKKSSVYILYKNVFNLQLVEELSKRLFLEYAITDVELATFNDNNEDIIEIINQSYCRVIVTIGFDSTSIKAKTAVPVIDAIKEFNNNSIKEMSLSVAKILSDNNAFIWSKIRLNQCLKE